MKTSLVTLAFVIALGAHCLAGDSLVTFGSGSNTTGAAKLIGPHAAEPKISETAKSLKLSTPNAWSSVIQFLNLSPIPLTSLDQADSFTVTIKGSPSGSKPILRVQFVSPQNWQEWGIWEFDLSSIKEGEFTTLKALTPYSKPALHSEGALPTYIGSIQLFTMGDNNLPWELEIQSVGFAKAK